MADYLPCAPRGILDDIPMAGPRSVELLVDHTNERIEVLCQRAFDTDVRTTDVRRVVGQDGIAREEFPTRLAVEDEPRQARGVARQVDRFEVALAGSKLRAFLEG